MRTSSTAGGLVVLSDMTNRALTTAAAPTVCASDRVSADLRLAMLGVELPFAVLGDDLPGTTPDPGRIRIPAGVPEIEAALVAGALTIADAESAPFAVLTELSVAPEAGWIEGRPAPIRTEPELPPRTRPARVVAVVARPLTSADVDGLRTAAQSLDADIVAVVGSGPSPDSVPASVLRKCLAQTAALTVFDVPLAWRGGIADLDLAEAVASMADGSHLWLAKAAAHPETSPSGRRVERLTGAEVGDDLWAKVLHSLHQSTTVQDVMTTDDEALTRVLPLLTRWRPPRDRRGLVVFFTGLSGAGKSTLARGLAEQLQSRTDRTVTLLDGDVVRRLLSSGLGFDRDSRDLNVRRIGFVAAEVARHGGIAVCAPIAPYAASRSAVREMVEAFGDLVLVHVSTPLEECERRDVKGLYAKARAGLVSQFTGISDDYDLPVDADLSIDTSNADPSASLAAVIDHLRAGGWITPAGE